MPKLRESPERAFYKKLTNDLESRMIYMGTSKPKLAEKTGMKYGTLCKRFREPETFLLGELVSIMTALKMDLGGVYEAKI